jgi:hypothetical protein
VPQASVVDVTNTESYIRITYDDRSTMTIPRMWHGRITDIALAGNLAGAVLSSTVSLAAIETELTGERPSHGAVCAELEGVQMNQVFYRREPHLMRRYSALAFDNIRRAPLAFVTASVYRPCVCSSSPVPAIGRRRSSSPRAVRSMRRQRSHRPSTCSC